MSMHIYLSGTPKYSTAQPFQHSNQTPTSSLSTVSEPTAQPPLISGQAPTARPSIASGETPTAKPLAHSGQTPTAAPPMHSGQSPTAHPPYVSGETPSIHVTPSSTKYECTHGWTKAMSISTPSITGDDQERIPDLRRKYDFCNETNIVAIRCAGLISEKSAEEMGETVICDKSDGLVCYGSDQDDKKCEDYAIQVFCDCRISKCSLLRKH